jgi:DNA invertase Pin-like site-specific DNA recombinase
VKAKGAALKCTEQPIDTSSASGKCFFDVLSAFAEFETSLRKERQAEGIAKAKKAGVYKGRPVSIKEDKIAEMKRLKAEGWGATKIAEKVGVSRISVYRALAES